MNFALCCLTFITVVSGIDSTDIETHVVNGKVASDEHNIFRKKYGVPLLKSDYTLSLDAVKCLKKMLVNYNVPKWHPSLHPCEPGKKSEVKKSEGENIYVLYRGKPLDIEKRNTIFGLAVDGWEKEVQYINFSYDDWFLRLNTKDPRKPIGHFTQLVWKATTEVGCAIGTRISESVTMVVCRYLKAGNNFYGRAVLNNVPRVKKVCGKDKDWCSHAQVDCKGNFAAMYREHCPNKCKAC